MPLVMKFGGSSVADADRLRRVADLVRSSMGQTPLVVLSATGGTTNTLVAASHAAAASGDDAGCPYRPKNSKRLRQRSGTSTGIGPPG